MGFRFEANDADIPDVPGTLVEPNDMQIIAPPCHPYEPVKVPDSLAGPFHCLICGQKFAVWSLVSPVGQRFRSMINTRRLHMLNVVNGMDFTRSERAREIREPCHQRLLLPGCRPSCGTRSRFWSTTSDMGSQSRPNQ